MNVFITVFTFLPDAETMLVTYQACYIHVDNDTMVSLLLDLNRKKVICYLKKYRSRF